VTQLKQAVDTFAQNYTSGASLSQDTSAYEALESSLNTISQDQSAYQFAANHVLTSSQVAQLQQAVNTFAQNYTNGSNLTQDASAYTALRTSLQGLAPGATRGIAVGSPISLGGVSGPLGIW